MSLEALPIDLITTLSLYVDGSDWTRLVQCGCAKLNASLKRARLELVFQAHHVGFLNIVVVFTSIAKNFVKAESLVLIGWSHTGMPPTLPACAVSDAGSLQGISLGVETFGVVSVGALYKTVLAHLRKNQNLVDMLFPNVTRWFVGEFFNQYSAFPRDDTKYGCNYTDRKDWLLVIPRSVTSLSIRDWEIQSVTHLDHDDTAGYSLPHPETTTELVLPQFNMSNELKCQYTNLTVLHLVCLASVSMSDLPRSLVSFHACSDSWYRPDMTCHLTCIDPPPFLQDLQVDGYTELVMVANQPLPSHLIHLQALYARDLHHVITAYTLPPGLKTMHIQNVIRGEGPGRDDATHLIGHLFDNVNNQTWASRWPKQLCFKIGLYGPQLGSFEVLLEHFCSLMDNPSCRYTFENALVNGNMEWKHLRQYGHGILLNHILKNKACIFLDYTDNMLDDLFVIEEALAQTSLVVPYSTCVRRLSIRRTFDSGLTEEKALLKRIDTLCPLLSELHYSGDCNALNVPPWVRSLDVEHRLPYQTKNTHVDMNPTSLPACFASLPSHLHTIDIKMCGVEWDHIDQHMCDLLDLMPRNLQHFRFTENYDVRRKAEDIVKYVPHLPLRLKSFYCSIFKVTATDVERFCRAVSEVPSLHWLVASFMSYDAVKGVSKVGSYHCHTATQFVPCNNTD
jgi:hypothetical protein